MSREESNLSGLEESRWSEKCRLMDAVDSLRRPERPGEAAAAVESADVEALRERLRSSEETCELLRDEVRCLEQQSLTALAEASRLRKELDTAIKRRADCSFSAIEAGEWRQRLMAADSERRLLVAALSDSENEIVRLTRTLDLMARKFQAV